MRIGMKIFFMIGSITAWFSQAILDGRISAEECFQLLMLILSGLGLKTDFDASKLRDAMLAMAEEEDSPDPESVLDFNSFMEH